jgi:hypothetical protein
VNFELDDKVIDVLGREAAMLPRGTVLNGHGRFKTGSKLAKFADARVG